jgi:transposase
VSASPARRSGAGERLGRSVARWNTIHADVLAVETTIQTLLASTAGQVLTSLPGVGVIRAATFAAFSLPIERFPSAGQLYSATDLAPARYQSATINRTGRISRTGLAEHRDALMGIAWGLSQRCAPFIERDAELRPGHGPDPSPRRSCPPRLPAHLPRAAHPATLRRTALPSRQAPERAVTAALAMPLDGAT